MYVTMGTSKQNIQGNEQIESHYYFKYYSKVFTTGQAKLNQMCKYICHYSYGFSVSCTKSNIALYKAHS